MQTVTICVDVAPTTMILVVRTTTVEPERTEILVLEGATAEEVEVTEDKPGVEAATDEPDVVIDELGSVVVGPHSTGPVNLLTAD